MQASGSEYCHDWLLYAASVSFRSNQARQGLHCRRNTRTESSLPVPSYAIFPLRFLTKTSAPARTASSMRRRSFRRAASWSKDAPEPSSRYDRLMNRTRGDSSRLKRAGDGGVSRGERMYVRRREQYEALRNARESVKYEK